MHAARSPVSAALSAFALSGVLLLATTPADATVLFSDNFDAGAAAAWGNQSGGWRDTGGEYDATVPDNNPITYSDVTTLAGLTDFAIDVDVNDLDDGGIWLRSSYNSGAIDGVLLVTGGNTGAYNGFYWHVVTNGAFGPSQNFAAVAGVQGSDVHLRIEVVGDDYSLFLNGSGTALSTLTTSAHASGSIGLYDFSPTSGASAPRGQTFDNVVVTDLTAIAEPAALGLFGLGLAGLGIAARRRAR